MYDIYESLRKKKLLWVLILLSLVIIGCCAFPFRKPTKASDYSFLFGIIIGLSSISFVFTALLRKNPIKVFSLTLFTIAIGMCSRFLLEFGEVSNTVDFTYTNIFLFLILIPFFVMFVYLIVLKSNIDKNEI